MKTTLEIGGQKISIESSNVAADSGIISLEASGVFAGDEANSVSVEAATHLGFTMAVVADEISSFGARSSEGFGKNLAAGAKKVLRLIVNAMKNAITWVTSTVRYITQRISGKMIESAYASALGKVTPIYFTQAFEKVKGEKINTKFNTWYITKGDNNLSEVAEKLEALMTSITGAKKADDKDTAVKTATPEIVTFIKGLGVPADITDGKAAANYIAFGNKEPTEAPIAIGEFKNYVTDLLPLAGKEAGKEASKLVGKKLTSLAKTVKVINIVGTKAKLVSDSASKEINDQRPDNNENVATAGMVNGLHQEAKDIQFVVSFTTKMVEITFQGMSFQLKLIRLILKQSKADVKTDIKDGKAAVSAAKKAEGEKAKADAKKEKGEKAAGAATAAKTA